MTAGRADRRVLFWSANFPPSIGGIEALAGGLVRALEERGYRLLVVAPGDGPGEATWGRSTTVLRLPFLQVLAERDTAGMLRLRRRLRKLKRELAPQLVHVNGLHPAICFHLDTEVAPSAPQLVTLHSWRELPCEPGTGFGRLLRGASWVACCSASVLARARAAVPEIAATSSVVFNGAAFPSRVPSPLPLAPPRILCLGRLEEDKGFDLALNAFARVRERRSDARLTLAGDGPARGALERLAAHLGVAAHVDFRGWVRPEDVASLIDTATLVVVPSRFEEGSNLVAIEASQMARPVVATAIGGLREVVEDGRTGLIVEPEDARALAEAVARLLDDPPLARSLGDRARERARGIFTWRSYVEGYAALYDRLVAGSSRAD